MPYTWIENPPVSRIETLDDFQALCTLFMAETRRLETNEDEAWKERKRLARGVAIYLRGWARAYYFAREHKIFCVYKPSAKIIGLMGWRRQVSSGFAHIAMLPEYESEGTILVEYAVNLSEEAKCEGRVRFPQASPVRPHRPDWTQYLPSEDFVPSESDEWKKFDGRWRRLIQVKAAIG